MQGSLHQEEQCHDTVCMALQDAFVYFAKGTLVSSDPRQPQGRQQPLSVAQASELLDVYTTLLVAAPSEEARSAVLRRTFDTSMFNTLVNIVTQPLLFAPDVSAGYSLQQTFAQLRTNAIQAINKVLLFSASSQGSASIACRAVQSERYVEGLLQLLSSPATFETLRVAAAESIFVFVLRLEEGRSFLLQTDLLQSLFNCLVLEPAAIVRNFFCASIREIVDTHPNALTDTKTVEVITKLMSLDESPDVRALTAEIIDVVLRSHTARHIAAQIISTPADILHAIKDRLDKEQSMPVVEAHAKLMETMIYTAVTISRTPGSFFDACGQLHIERSLIGALNHPPKAASAAARALRFLFQYSPCEQQVGYRVVTHFQTLSTLLKVAMDLTNPKDESADQSHQVMCVEVGLAVSMLLAQSPVYRQQIVKELHAFPMWSTTLRNGLIAFLNMAALDYYSNIVLIDCTGTELNSLAGVEWSEGNKPKKSTIRAIFAQQDQRVREQRVDHGHVSPPPTMELEVKRKERLTFIVLNFAVHLTLSEGADGTNAPAGSVTMGADSMMAPGTPRGVAAGDATTPMRGGAPSYADPSGLGRQGFGGSPPRGMMAGASPGRFGAGSPSVNRTARTSSLPKFPRSPRAGNAVGGGGGPDASVIASRTNLTQHEREEMAFAYDKFDSALKLVLDLAHYYGRKRKQQAQFAPTPDGFVVRQDRLKNPWGPVVKKESLKSWAVNDLKEGDLFYFSLPFDELAVEPVKILLEKGRRHMAQIKKMMITTPQTAKGRRWFLYDMLNNVMPKVMDALNELLGLVKSHGGDNVRFPLFLFREKEMHLGERAIHSGNVLQVIDQVKYYMSQNPNELVGVSASYIQHIQEKMTKLQNQRFTGDEELSPAASDDDDDDLGYGHGGISSESDMD